ncbi:tail sheath [Acidovorax phage ACP17]|uniref:Tail sheath protein n=1 Tax=Acidovorax phage ACP17 TaxID=2010329 RepID=A0A218M2U9_9CAUD|nr:tail sheath [Acidovorax phage ACP17]ASD50372.1 tail sheath protein [Acidovorax phage ACP17]
MANQVSPGVVIREIDLTNSVPNVGTAGGATVGEFMWGPVDQLTRLASVRALETQFGKPTDKNHIDWFSASNFLSYTGDLTVVRVVDEDSVNATDDGAGILVKNSAHFQIVQSGATTVKYAAKYPGSLGNSVALHIADGASFTGWAYANLFDGAPGTSDLAAELGAKNDELHAVVVDKNGQFTGVVGAVLETFPYMSKASNGKDANSAPSFYRDVLNQRSAYVWVLDGEVGDTVSEVSGGAIGAVTVTAGGTGYTSATVTFTGGGTGATGTVQTSGGAVTGVTITNPGKGYVNPTVVIAGPGNGATATTTATPKVTKTSVAFGSPMIDSLGVPALFNALEDPVAAGLLGGKDSTAITAAELNPGYSLFGNVEEVDVGLIFVGHAGGQTSHQAVVQHVIDNVVTVRRDAMVFFSPKLEDILDKTQSAASTAVIATRNQIARSTSFASMDSGWKLQYDVYNNKTRYIPLNADIAGLCAQVSNTFDDWWSPGGYTRGQVKNVSSLVFNPDQQSRDAMYKVGINSVVTFKTDGTILYGDKTLQGKNSAFSYIGTRRLFILLQKSIASAAKYSLFEFNDDYTRANFRNMVEPYLREVKGRRGLDDFRVVCDRTNNTDQVIMSGEFVGAIYVKPQYSIQWVRLDFVAVRRDVEFSEAVGQF